MVRQINKVNDNTIEVISPISTFYDIGNLINQANTLTQNILDLQNQLNDVNDIISNAKNAGLKVNDADLISQEKVINVIQ